MGKSQLNTHLLVPTGTAVTPVHQAIRRPRNIAIGFFDGVHSGHQKVIAGCDTILTFDPHPLQVLRPQLAPQLLTDFAHRAKKLAALPIREIVVVPFNTAWANQPAAGFIEDVLVDLLDAHLVSIGSNFRFGAGGNGDVDMLQSDSRFSTRVNTLVSSGPDVVSSTLIRGLVLAGKVEKAAELLSSPLSHPAHLASEHTLTFDSTLLVPRHGTFNCTINGQQSRLRMNGSQAEIIDSAFSPKTATVEIAFHQRDDHLGGGRDHRTDRVLVAAGK